METIKKSILSILPIIISFCAIIISLWALYISKESQRAYLYAKQEILLFKRQSDEKGVYWGTGIEWENSGNTEAKNLTIENTCVFSTNNLLNDPTKAVPNEKNIVVPAKFIIGPHQHSLAGVCYFSDNQITEAAANKAHIYMVSTAKYNDLFNQKHITENCFEAINIDISSYRPDYKTGGIPFSLNLCSTHNCVDDECKIDK